MKITTHHCTDLYLYTPMRQWFSKWGARTLSRGGAMSQTEKKKRQTPMTVVFSESSLRGEMQRAGLTQTNQKHSFISDPPIKTESYHLNASCTYASVYKSNCRDNSGIHDSFLIWDSFFNLDQNLRMLNSSGESARLFLRASFVRNRW